MKMRRFEKRFVNSPRHSDRVARQAETRVGGLDPRPGGRLLDVGCGNGAAAIHLTRAFVLERRRCRCRPRPDRGRTSSGRRARRRPLPRRQRRAAPIRRRRVQPRLHQQDDPPHPRLATGTRPDGPRTQARWPPRLLRLRRSRRTPPPHPPRRQLSRRRARPRARATQRLALPLHRRLPYAGSLYLRLRGAENFEFFAGLVVAQFQRFCHSEPGRGCADVAGGRTARPTGT